MLNYKDYGIILQIVKYCQRIVLKTKDVNFDIFKNDDDLKEIVCFGLLQIGELAKNLSNDFVKNYNLVPWKQIKGMRDKVAHGYGTIDIDLVFNTSKNDIVDLLAYCQEILNTESN